MKGNGTMSIDGRGIGSFASGLTDGYMSGMLLDVAMRRTDEEKNSTSSRAA
jgi:hypothetical protein